MDFARFYVLVLRNVFCFLLKLSIIKRHGEMSQNLGENPNASSVLMLIDVLQENPFRSRDLGI